MKVYFEVILLFLIIEIETNAFIAGNPAYIQELQESKSSQSLLPTNSINQLNGDEFLEENYTLETLRDSHTSINDFQIPFEHTREKNHYQNEADNSNTVYSASIENYFKHPNDEDNYKPLIYKDSKSTESSFELLKATSPNSNGADKPLTVPQLPFGLPNGYSSSSSQEFQTPTLIMGGFSILVMPMPGLTPGNMANLFLPGQQLGQASGTNPFLGPSRLLQRQGEMNSNNLKIYY